MVINKADITRYIPQRAPFIMIDEVLEIHETGFKTAFTIPADSPLAYADGTVSEGVVTEHIAQSCAAGFGYQQQQAEGGEARLGFIGAITRLSNSNMAKTGDKLITEIQILSTFENIHLIEGKSSVDGIEYLRCQMKIVLA